MSEGNGSQAVAVSVRRRQRYDEPTPRRYVDFHANAKDFQCVLLAAIGWSTAAIASYTDLTEGQVAYRIGKAEQGRRRGEDTQRMLYRQGKSRIATAVVGVITSRGSVVKKQITTTLDKRGLYTPRPRGVMH